MWRQKIMFERQQLLFISWATSMPPITNWPSLTMACSCAATMLPTRLCTLFAAVALPTTHKLCMFAANKKSKKDDITINYIYQTIMSRKAGGCMAFDIGGRGNRQCYVSKTL
jgi:hypothetical protein